MVSDQVCFLLSDLSPHLMTSLSERRDSAPHRLSQGKSRSGLSSPFSYVPVRSRPAMQGSLFICDLASISLTSAKEGCTPLMWAANYGNLAIVNHLLSSSSNHSLAMNVSDSIHSIYLILLTKTGATALHWACSRSNAEIVIALLNAGARWDAVTKVRTILPWVLSS
jgi:ankyrin repeat protein